jgi:uncharacterized RDD family membrane protein YckC
VAILIDAAIVGFVHWVVVLPIAAAASHRDATPTPNHVVTATLVVSAIVAYSIIWVASAIYYGALNGSRRGQTVGKMALGIAVRDERTGGPIGFWRGLGRYLITLVFTLALVVPYVVDSLAPLWDRRRQAWHDKVARTVVVDLRP